MVGVLSVREDFIDETKIRRILDENFFTMGYDGTKL